MTLGLICHNYSLTWAEAKALRLWEIRALADHLNEQAEANKSRR